MPLVASSKTSAPCARRARSAPAVAPLSRVDRSFQRRPGQHFCCGSNYERQPATTAACTVPGRRGCSTALRVVWLHEVVSVREGWKSDQTRVTRRQKPPVRPRKMESLSLSVNGVSYTVAAELAPTNDPFSGPIKTIAQWNFTILAVLMFVVTSLSLCENFLVMFITFKFKQLRQPLNYIIVNLAIADFLVSITGGLISFLTNARGYFFLGRWACVLEGFAVTFFGKYPARLPVGPEPTVGVSVGTFKNFFKKFKKNFFLSCLVGIVATGKNKQSAKRRVGSH